LRRVPPGVVYLAGLAPLIWIVWLTVTGGIGIDPVKEIEHRLGKVALWFLIGGLAVTPLLRHARINLIRYRRALGLLAFLYVVLHLTAWLWLDMAGLWAQIAGDLVKRPYLYLGLAGFALLLPLTASSNDAAQRRLGARWRGLHRLTYPAVGLGVLHYLWQMKVITPEGWLWAGVFLGLMALRLRWRRG
jgi:sulfoxide reductase heme-binding subunit YedZ